MAEKTKPQKEKEGERIFVIPLRKKLLKSPENVRTNRSVSEIRFFLAKHMKSDPSRVSVSQQLNESLWKGGIHKRLSRIKVKVSTDEDGKIIAKLPDEMERLKKERKQKLGIRERLTKRREASGKKPGEPTSTEEKTKEKPVAKEKPAEKKEEKKPEPKKEKEKPEEPKKEPAREEIEQDILLDE